MANLDTRSKRASSVGLLAAWLLAPALPDGTLDQGDRQHAAQTYSGILAGAFVPPPTPPPADGGGDRGVVLFREEKIPEPPRQRIPRAASFKVTTFQGDQKFSAVFTVESSITAAFEFEANDFALDLEALSTISAKFEQEQAVSIELSAIQIHKSVPVKASFESVRSRVEFVSGDNDFHVEISVE